MNLSYVEKHKIKSPNGYINPCKAISNRVIFRQFHKRWWVHSFRVGLGEMDSKITVFMSMGRKKIPANLNVNKI